METKDKLEAKAIIGETNDTSNADVLKKYKKKLAAIRRRSETHRHRHERVTGNAVVTSGTITVCLIMLMTVLFTFELEKTVKFLFQ